MLEKFLTLNKISFEKNVSLSTKTWLKTGGDVDFWILPVSVDQLVDLVRFLKGHDLPFDIVGHTTNIYFRPNHHQGIIISVSKMNKYEVQDDFIVCDCGASVAKISKVSVEQGFEGFYGLVNLPGTVGAAIINNSSCFQCSVSALLQKADVLFLQDLSVGQLQYDDFNYSHHFSKFKFDKNIIVLRAYLKREQGVVDIEKEKARQVTLQRRMTQEPGAYTLGSVCSQFELRNNWQNFVARLLNKIFSIFSKNKNHLKYLLLKLYGYDELSPFVSNKTINTFIWLKGHSDIDDIFQKYKEFLMRVYNNVHFEIEEK